MKLSKTEVQKLKSAGFDESQVAEIQVAKAEAGQDWLSIFQKLIEHGPEILSFLKLFGGLFAKPLPK